MQFQYNTGGREKYYKKANVRDCVTRATAIANRMDYKEAYKLVWKYQGESPRNGVSRKATEKCLRCLGWEYIDLDLKLKFLNEFEIPNEDLIFRIKISGQNGTHVFACIGGVINDTWDCTKFNPRVLGYWRRR